MQYRGENMKIGELKTKTQLFRLGKCTKCGDCCRDETLEARIQAYKKAGVPYKIINNDCMSFDPNTGLCRNYENRPLSCKQFPLLPVDIVALPRCGYSFVTPI